MANIGTQAHVTKAIIESKGTIIAIAAFSLVINALALTGPLFMLQVYDRVLTSYSVPTLIALAAIAIMLYGFFGLFDLLRAWLAARLGTAFDHRLASHAFEAGVRIATGAKDSGKKINPLRDVEQIRNFISGQGLTALFDLPWMPIYLAIVYLLHPMLGTLALAGAAILFSSTLLHEWLIRSRTGENAAQRNAEQQLVEAAGRNAEILSAMGMLGFVRNRWQQSRHEMLASQQTLGSVSSTFSSFSRTTRLMLQSAMLGLGAYLAINSELSPGALIASSIIFSRAMAPVEQVISQWRNFVAARLCYRQLKSVLPAMEASEPATELAAPSSQLSVEKLVVAAPGGNTPLLKGIDFSLSAGDAMGIIGPSGAGKTSLVRALIGSWTATRGEIRLDGARLDQYGTDALGASIGYLPQDVELFDGTISENIARFNPDATSPEIIAAAKAAGCHEMILDLENGYDTRIGNAGQVLSGGQRQRIGLARALFGTPFLVVLDEPNSNLDHNGEVALNRAIAALRQAGSIVVIVAHRTSALAAANKVLTLKDGNQADFGERDEVLNQLLAGRAKGDLKAANRDARHAATLRVA